ncbi:unnamed protein product [Pieris macdunnoughi]|uniref:Uncharacterized protein n=1 Tax=Pieris macdunnoughi TaxID=345717 RepID=A0A821PIK2_9NEOP|nr:unnamed protein product [Pieris macdunnoughi]
MCTLPGTAEHAKNVTLPTYFLLSLPQSLCSRSRRRQLPPLSY